MTVLDKAITNPDLSRRWALYCDDMLDLRRLDLLEIAREHGLSGPESAQFVVNVEVDEGRERVSVSTMLRVTANVRRRAAANPGRYYIASSLDSNFFSLPNADASMATATLDLRKRRGDGVIFIHPVRESRKTHP